MISCQMSAHYRWVPAAIFLGVFLLQSLSKQVQDSLAKANEVAEETYSSLRTVRSFANERAETELYASKLQATYRINIKESIVYAGYAWTTLVSGCISALIENETITIVMKGDQARNFREDNIGIIQTLSSFHVHPVLVFQFFELFLVVATLYYGGHLVLDDILTGGHLVSFILYQMELGFAIEVLIKSTDQ